MRSHYPCRDSTVDGPNTFIFFINNIVSSEPSILSEPHVFFRSRWKWKKVWPKWPFFWKFKPLFTKAAKPKSNCQINCQKNATGVALNKFSESLIGKNSSNDFDWTKTSNDSKPLKKPEAALALSRPAGVENTEGEFRRAHAAFPCLKRTPLPPPFAPQDAPTTPPQKN